MEYKSIENLEVLTPSGFKKFEGISKQVVDAYMHITFTDDTHICCSLGHLLKFPNGEYLEACHILVGDILFSGHEVKSVECIEDKLEVYDLINVEDVNEYYGNNIVGHNCAHIDDIETVWASAQQTLATGGKAILLSSPNGTGNFFHKTWEDATLNPKSRFFPIKLHWSVHPERDQSWRDKQDEVLGPRMAAQECDASFISSGATVIEGELLEWFTNTTVMEPVEKRGFDHNLWIWEYPDYSKQYIVTADVARGDGGDYSAFHVIDVDSLTQVAEYRGFIGTKEYGHMLHAIASEYNNALLVVENSNVGWATLQVIIEKGYQNLFYSSKDLNTVDIHAQLAKGVDLMDKKRMIPGFTTSGRTRPLLISKLDTLMRERAPIVRSARLIAELKVFIWKNDRAEAQSGYNDDLVMSFSIGLWVRDTAFKLRDKGIELSKQALSHFTKTTNNVSQTLYLPGNSKSFGWTMPTANGEQEDLSWLI